MGQQHQRSPLAPDSFPKLPGLPGLKIGVAATGMKYTGRPDVMLALLDPGSVIAATFTKSKTRSAPVDWCAENLPAGDVRAILVNAGNANAFTGTRGMRDVRTTASAVAKQTGCRPEEVYIASTGVIGEPLDAAQITASIQSMIQTAEPDDWQAAAQAILTTDTFPKAASATARLDGRTVTINGIAKGSGMIAPDMATMLAFLFTDAPLPARILQALLSQSVDRSFNCITVDSDTSTSDTVLLCSTGAKRDRPKGLRTHRDPRLEGFAKALDKVTSALSRLIVCDGEGAEKLITITVTGAESDIAARRIGLAIGNSPLVKTAIAGEDANWGRIVMAVGKSGEAADRDRLKISIGGHAVARRGQVVPGYDEARLEPHMQGRDIQIKVDVGIGKGRATVWTCDLTHRYIDINASYRS